MGARARLATRAYGRKSTGRMGNFALSRWWSAPDCRRRTRIRLAGAI